MAESTARFAVPHRIRKVRSKGNSAETALRKRDTPTAVKWLTSVSSVTSIPKQDPTLTEFDLNRMILSVIVQGNQEILLFDAIHRHSFDVTALFRLQNRDVIKRFSIPVMDHD